MVQSSRVKSMALEIGRLETQMERTAEFVLAPTA
jgi:hypothetical protein